MKEDNDKDNNNLTQDNIEKGHYIVEVLYDPSGFEDESNIELGRHLTYIVPAPFPKATGIYHNVKFYYGGRHSFFYGSAECPPTSWVYSHRMPAGEMHLYYKIISKVD